MDFASRAVLLHGHHILFLPALANAHFPSAVNRDFYAPFMEASRIYVTFKRYFWVERRPPKAILFLLLAYVHILAHDLRRRGDAGCGGLCNHPHPISLLYPYLRTEPATISVT